MMDELALIWILTWVLFLVAAIPLLRLLRTSKRADVMEAIYPASAYFLLIFPFRSLYALVHGTPFLGDPPFDENTRRAWALALAYLTLSFAVFLLGYYGPLGRLFARAVPRLPSLWRWNRVGPLAVGLSLVGLSSFAWLIQYLGGWQAYLTEKQRTLTAGGTTYLYNLLGCLSVAAAILYVRHTRTRARAHLIQTLAALTLTLAVGATTGAKGAVFFPLLRLLILRHYLVGRLRPRHILLMGLLLVALIPGFNLYRHLPSFETLPRSYLNILTDPGLLLTHLLNRFHPLDAVVTIIRDTPNLFDYQYGSTLAPLLVAWIPRQIWPDKPLISSAKVFGETYWAPWFAGTGSAPSLSVLGEAYINFHLPGMLVVAFSAGWLLRALYCYLVASYPNYSGVFVYALLTPYWITFWEMDIAGAISLVFFWAVLVIATCFVVALPLRTA